MNKPKKLKLSIKIAALLGTIIFLIIFVYLIVYTSHYQEYESEVIGQENINTLHSIEYSLGTVIESVDNYSKMILADSAVQQQMEKGDILEDFNTQQALMKRIYSVLQFSEYIDMIWLMDQQGQRLVIGAGASIQAENTGEIRDSYEELRKPYGKAELIIEEGESTNSLMLIRSYNSLEDFRSLGLIGIQINKGKLEKMFSESINFEKEQIVVLTEKNEVIYSGGNCAPLEKVIQMGQDIGKTRRELLRREIIGGQDYFLSGVANNEKGWKIIRYSPILRDSSIRGIVKFNITLVIIIGFLIFIGAAAISNMLTKPIQQLLGHMKDIENGELAKISEHTYLSEFRALFKGYNKMVDQIHRLIKETIERQRQIRLVELNEIQEQMKPHFLYNTLDSIEALAMMGDTDGVCKLIESLGDFYRKSVSGGREFLTIEEEIRMVIDYTEILKIRFGDTFQVDIQMEESCKEYRIPKLTIQPLVENSFQHGIRVKKKFGYIRVNVKAENHRVHIMVWDNGEGVPDEILDELLDHREHSEKKSLGLRGTIQRLSLLYEDAFSYEIRNKEASEIHLYIDIDTLGEKKNG